MGEKRGGILREKQYLMHTRAQGTTAWISEVRDAECHLGRQGSAQHPWVRLTLVCPLLLCKVPSAPSPLFPPVQKAMNSWPQHQSRNSCSAVRGEVISQRGSPRRDYRTGEQELGSARALPWKGRGYSDTVRALAVGELLRTLEISNLALL